MQAAHTHTHTSEANQAERKEEAREREQKSMALAEWADKVGRPAKCDDDDAIWRPPNVVTDSTLAAPPLTHSLTLPALLCLASFLPACAPLLSPPSLPLVPRECSKTTHLASGLPALYGRAGFSLGKCISMIHALATNRNSQVTKRSNCIAPNWCGHQTENLC